MDEKPLVSIVTPSYNQGQFLEETILSVLNQDYPNIEYMIIDGGSTDNSVEIIRKYEERLAYWVSEPDGGQADAINKGWRRSKGEFIGWINSDDLLLPCAISKTVEFLNKNFEYGFVYGDLIRIDEKGKYLGSLSYCDFDIIQIILNAGWISQQGNLFRRSVYDEIGELDRSLHFQMDLDYWIRAGLCHKVGYLKLPLAKFRTHPKSKTSCLPYVAANDILHIYKKIYSQNKLPKELIDNKNLAWASAYSSSSKAMRSANRYYEAYCRFFRAIQLYPGIITRKKQLNELGHLLILSIIGGKNSLFGRKLIPVVNLLRKYS